MLATRLMTEILQNLIESRGMHKFSVDVIGEATLTKNTATFLRKIDVEHLAAKVLIEAPRYRSQAPKSAGALAVAKRAQAGRWGSKRDFHAQGDAVHGGSPHQPKGRPSVQRKAHRHDGASLVFPLLFTFSKSPVNWPYGLT